jgi:hypothetical protein
MEDVEEVAATAMNAAGSKGQDSDWTPLQVDLNSVLLSAAAAAQRISAAPTRVRSPRVLRSPHRPGGCEDSS